MNLETSQTQINDLVDVASQLKESVAYIETQTKAFKPRVALVLGSGLGDLANRIDEARVVIPYADIPYFQESKVHGHANALVFGRLNGVEVVAQQGRLHAYEGNTLQQVVFPLRVMRMLGAQTLIVTNAAGGVNPLFNVGDLMLITDHINLLGNNPLVGENIDALGPRFCDMTEAYTPSLRVVARDAAARLQLLLREGVYCAFKGPSYETPAEIRMARVIGADAVGMSTVPEVICASHMSMSVLGISCITNMAAGMGDKLNHDEVIETTTRVKKNFQALILELLTEIKKNLK